MSILTKNEILDLAKNNDLLGSDWMENNVQPCSYDLRIGAIFKDNIIYSKEFTDEKFTNNIDIKPSEIVSILTLEKITIPKDCAGTVFAINHHSSTGFLILNPGHIDPGFSGSISICAINLSNTTKTISIGEPIFTLIIQKLIKELDNENLYNNKKYKDRKEEEQIYLKEKAKKFSSSVFDLITGYDGAKEMAYKILRKKMLKFGGDILKIIGAIVLIMSFIQLFNPNFKFFNYKIPENEKQLNKKEEDYRNYQKTPTINKDSTSQLK